MAFIRALFCIICLTLPLAAQELQGEADALGSSTELAPPPQDEAPRAETGGATTLEDIMRRQQGLAVDNPDRQGLTGDPDSAASATEPLGTLGGASDPDLWRGLRFDSADITTTARGPAATTLIQDRGMWWLTFREGPLLTWGLYALAGMAVLLALFFLIRGRIRVDGTVSARTLTRFVGIERFSHWLLASSFILLGITGLITLAGRKWLIPAFGPENFALIATASKWVHNNVSWAFMLALVLIFVMWVWHNLPDWTDLVWIAKGGGIIGKAHPPAKKFNFGQKIVFWSVIVLGASISASGLSLLFPFELPMFAATFEKLNAFGLPQMIGMAPLETALAPHEEMQYAQLWHAIVSFALMVIIVAHIYIGSLGMEGAFDAMGSGEVSQEWADQHHSIWAAEEKARARGRAAEPAE